MIPFFYGADVHVATAPPTVTTTPMQKCADVSDEDEWDLDDQGCKKKREKKPWERGSIFGVRLGLTNTSGAEKNGTFVGAMAAVNSEQYHVGKIYSGHYSSFGYLGGGSAGLEGGIGGTAMFGARAPFGSKHGPLARVGTSMELQGNSRFYYSRLVLPMAEVGYQYGFQSTVVELGARGGNMITGRYNTGHRTKRELGGGTFEWGGYLAVHTRVMRLDASYTRIEPGDNYPGGAVGTLRGTGCGYFGRIGVCGDAMVVNGEGYIGLPRTPLDVASVYAGLTVGVVDL